MTPSLPNADVPDPPRPGSPLTGPPATAEPYGPLGLIVSTVLILTGSAAIIAVLMALAFGALVLREGIGGAMQHFSDLDMNDGKEPEFFNRVNVIIGLVAYASVSSAILTAARLRGGAGWARLVAWTAWPMDRDWRLFTALLVGVTIYSAGAGALVMHFHPESKDWVPTPSGRMWIVGFLALATLAAPITEELLFRGWIYTSLRRTIGVPVAMLLTAALFALAHWEGTHLYALIVFPIGLVLAFVRERTGTIAASITFHALYNGIASVLAFAGH